MEPVDLKLQLGDTIQLQPRDGEAGRRMQVKVIGHLPGQSLIVTTPRIKDKVMIIREGQPFVVRMMSGNRIVGFATTVLRTCSRPYAYLHLSSPKEMEQIVVRKAQRLRIKLFASLKNDNPDYASEKARPATIVDLSTTGALVTSTDPLGDIGDTVTLTCLFSIAGTEKLLAIPATLRNVYVGSNEDEEARGSFYHGLEFHLQNSKEALFVLHGFVYEQIVKAQTE